MHKHYTLNTAAPTTGNKKNLAVFSFRLVMILVLCLSAGKGWGQLFWRTDGTSGTWTGTNWSNPASATGGTAYTANTAANFSANSTVTFATVSIGNVTVSNGITVTVTQAGTLSMNGAVRTFDIGTGSTLTWKSQSVTANSAAGITKNGAGILDLGALTWTTNMNGGFTLNNGTVIVTGVKALGNGVLNINGGIVTTGNTTAVTPVVTGSISVGGDFQLGDAVNVSAGTGNLTFTNAMSLGAATRAITIGGVANYTFGGIISGTSSAGLTVNSTSTGVLLLTNVNTYPGTTTVTSGELRLNPSGNNNLSGACTFNGGKLATTGITATTSITFASINLSDNSTLVLGSNSHTVTFTSLSSFTAGKTLTITGWAGTYPAPTTTSTATAGKIFIGTTASLTAAQLAQIIFTNPGTGTNYPATQLSTGEIVPTTTLVVTTPGTQTAGVPFNVIVTSMDLGGNARAVTNATGFTLTTNGIAGAIGGTTTGTISAAGNTVTVSGVTLASAGVGATITATPTSGDNLLAGTSGTFNVISGGASTPPTLTAASGATVDANFDITYTDDPAWDAAVTTVKYGAATLTAGTDYSFAAGILTLKPTGGNAALHIAGTQTVTVSASGYTDATVSQTIGAGAANKLAMNVQPTAPATNGAALAIQPSVFIQDQYGNATTSTATITANTGSGTWTPGGNTTANGVSGTATFSGLTATSASSVTGATIDFTSPGLIHIISSGFNIPSPPADHLAFVGVTTNGIPNSNLASFTVEARRPDNSVDNTYITNIVITKASGSGTLSGTTTKAAVAGVATFNDLQFNAADNYTLNANSGSFSQITSGTIAVINSIASWTFETSQPTTSGPVSAEVGTGSASGSHVGASTYSTPLGNGSAHSYSSTNWAVGDYYQFQVSTSNYYNILIRFDQFGSATGPANFKVQYSTDGTTFSDFASNTHTIPSSSTWIASNYLSQYNFSYDLSAITALNGASTVYIRLVDNSTTSIGGATVGAAGTGRVDNFTITGTACTSPTAFNVTGGGTYCSGGSGVSIGLDGSVSGVNYQLVRGGNTNVGSPVAGTGSSISFGNQTVAGNYTVTATNATTLCTANMTGSVTVTIISNSWIGNSPDAADPTNWSCGTLPGASTDVIIPASPTGGNMPVLSGNLSVHNINLLGSSTIDLSGQTLTINGTVTGTGTLKGSSTSSLVIGGTAGTFNFIQTSPATRSLNNLTLNSGSSATLGTALDIYGVLGLTTSTLNLNDQSVTLKSTGNGFTGTASIANLTGSTLSHATNVTVERYIDNPGHRSWHLLSAQAVTGSQTIFQSWQENGTIGGSIIAQQGTLVTSPNYNGGGNGFDATSLNASILIHNQGLGAGPSWDNTLANTNASTISSHLGYMLFVRGDRNYTSANPLTTSATVLRTNGLLSQGNLAVVVSSTGSGYTLVGNLYASPIDMNPLFTGIAHLDQNMYIWDPTLTGNFGVGGFRLVERNGDGTYQQTPVVAGGTSLDASSRYIHSGQAFFLHATGADATVSFTEAIKASSVSGVNPFVQSPADQQLFANLLIVNPGNIESLADGIRVRFDASYSATTADDINKIDNFAENLSSYREGKKLIVEKRPMIGANDTIFLNMANMGIKDYRFQVGTFDFVQANVSAYLQDAFLGTSTLLDLTGGIKDVDFSVTGNPASAASNRFTIVFKTNAPLPVTFTSIRAYQQGTGVAVEWKVANQLNIQQYEVERSTDGINFSRVRIQLATGNSSSDVTYNWLDASPVTGDNFYRVRSIGLGGDIKYTTIVKVKIGKVIPVITVYPNPVINRTISVEFTGMDKGVYALRLMNAIGQVVFTQQLTHTGGSGTQTIGLGNNFAGGSYQLEIIKPDNTKTVQSLIITD